MILCAIIDVTNPVSGLEEQVYLTSARDYTFEGKTFLPILKPSANYQQTLFSRGTTSGDISVGITSLIVDNTEGLLDYLETYGVAGKKVVVYILDDNTVPLADEHIYFRGSVVIPLPNLKVSTFTLMDRLEELDVPISKTSFLGTNAGPTGLEGSEEAIKGQNKPAVYGAVFNAPLYAANSSTHTFSCNYSTAGERKPVTLITAVRDKGGEILFGADHADAAALALGTPASGYYDSCLAEGLIKLGSRPVGDVTADIQESAIVNCSAPRVVKRILEEVLGFEAGKDFVAGDLETLHSKNAWPVGIYITGETSVLSAVAELLGSIGGWVCPEADGVLRFGRIEDPELLVSQLTITVDQFADLDKEPTNDDGKNTPAKRLELNYGRNWKPNPLTSILESVENSARVELSKEYSTVVSENSAILNVHPRAGTLKQNSLLAQSKSKYIPGGACATGDEVNFTLTQISGTGGSATFDGMLTIDPGTGVYQVVGTVPGADLAPGSYLVELLVTSGTVSVTAAGASSASQTVENSSDVPERGSLRITHASEDITITLSASSVTGTAVLGVIKVRPAYDGLSPQEEADRRFALQSKTQARYTFNGDFKEFRALRPGLAITLKMNRFNLPQGKKFLVIGKDIDLSKDQSSLDVWRVND